MAAYNLRYARLVDCEIVFDAPLYFREGDRYLGNPSEAMYNERGWKLVVRVFPTTPAPVGMHWEHLGWDDSGPRIVETFHEVADPPRVIRYSKRKFVLSLASRGLYTRFCAWADSVEAIPGSGLTISALLGQSTFMQSDDQNLSAVIGAARELLGAETVDEILAESEDDE